MPASEIIKPSPAPATNGAADNRILAVEAVDDKLRMLQAARVEVTGDDKGRINGKPYLFSYEKRYQYVQEAKAAYTKQFEQVAKDTQPALKPKSKILPIRLKDLVAEGKRIAKALLAAPDATIAKDTFDTNGNGQLDRDEQEVLRATFEALKKNQLTNPNATDAMKKIMAIAEENGVPLEGALSSNPSNEGSHSLKYLLISILSLLFGLVTKTLFVNAQVIC